MAKPKESADSVIDPLVLHAENVFAQRQARAFVIDRDLLGEPVWDIILCAVIAEGRGAACTVEYLARKIGESPKTTERWVNIMIDRSVLEIKDENISLNSRPENAMRRHLKMQMDALIAETSRRK